jgi:hypothetical protein
MPVRVSYPAYCLTNGRRGVGFAATLLVHVALLALWQIARTLPLPSIDGARNVIHWIRLPALPLAHPVVPSTLPPISSRVIHAAPAPVRIHPPIPILVPAPDAALPATTQSVTIAAPIPPTAASILDYARRNAGAIDRAARKENRPYIIAPPDSPGIRLRAGIERAHDLAPPKLWEAPKVDELVNQTGDGARRTRVITGNGTYCISERAPTTSIDMIETHGKLRLTNCPQHEDVATHQDWRTGQGN